MLLSLAGRRLYYDMVGSESGPVVCITHSLASDSGMWAEQMAPLLQAGFRVLRVDMRGHGGSDPVTGDYTMKPLADGTVERWFTDAFKPRKPGRWKQIRDTVAATTPAGYLGCSAAIMNFDFIAQLPALRLPTLVVCGADDPGTPASENRRLAGLVPGGRYEEIADARHFPNVEHPEAFNRIMMGWLEAQRHLS